MLFMSCYMWVWAASVTEDLGLELKIAQSMNLHTSSFHKVSILKPMKIIGPRLLTFAFLAVMPYNWATWTLITIDILLCMNYNPNHWSISPLMPRVIRTPRCPFQSSASSMSSPVTLALLQAVWSKAVIIKSGMERSWWNLSWASVNWLSITEGCLIALSMMAPSLCWLRADCWMSIAWLYWPDYFK